jgi:Protein of unknown function (DUF3467)
LNNPPPTPRVISPVQADAAMIGGVYANGLNVWHTPHEFTLDFVVNAEPPKQATGPAGEQVITAPQRLVARVRIPPGMVFDLIRAINNNLTNYEQALGQITRRGDDGPLYPPQDLGDTG